MSRFINPFPQYSDINGVPLAGGKLSFFESGTTTFKTIYQDIDKTIPAVNPQTLDSEGRLGDVFLDGQYNVELRDAQGVLVDQADPVFSFEETQGQLSEWDPTISYDEGDLVQGSDGLYYISETNGNINNNPVVDSVNWSKVLFLTEWNPNVSYSSVDIVVGSDGNIYRSKINNNLGNNPTSSPDEWGPAFNILTATLNIALPRGYKDGFTLSNDITDADHDIVISAGAAKDSTNMIDIVREATLTKRIDANWVEGDTEGGFPSGLTLTADTWYHVFVIVNDEGNVDAGYDSDINATNLLADATGYTAYRRVGSVLTDVSENILPFIQKGNLFSWITPFVEFNGSTFTGLIAINIPPDIRTRARIGSFLSEFTAEGTTEVLVTDADQNSASNTVFNLQAQNSGNFEQNTTNTHEPLSNTSSEINVITVSGASIQFQIFSHGWIDFFED